MNIASAITAISARELTRRAVWLASFLAFIHGKAVNGGEAAASVVSNATQVASASVEAYGKQFPQA